MEGNWTFGQRLALGFTLCCLALGVTAGLGLWSTNGLIENQSWVAHTQEVRRLISDVLSAVKDAETGQRGYLLTGRDEYLAPYRRARKIMEDTIARLRTLTADNRNQQDRIALIEAGLAAKVAELEETIQLRRTKGFDAALAVVLEGSGKRTMDEIRDGLGAMDQEEDRLLRDRNVRAAAAADRTRQTILWVSVGGALMIALLGFFITTSLSKQIGNAVFHIRTASAELQTAANQQLSGAKEHAIAMTEMNTTMTELLASSRQIAESAERVALAARETSTTAHSGDDTVERTRRSMDGIREQVDRVVLHMRELGQKSQRIGLVLDIITELTDQTNLLAVNATIEAVSAGESGRRFGVVADEIRKLADRVTVSAKEVRTLLDEVRGAVSSTVTSTETGSKVVEDGTSQFGAVAAAFSQIGALVSNTTEAAAEIQLSTKQQSSAVEQVNVAVKSITQTTRETESSTTQTLQAASQLVTLSRELYRIVQRDKAA